ncbi:LCP family protein [Vacuolonema iberomarrocanum]|uniref:LCP family protein n=1 Tax=Vacuolonema iberomarrocanum TaxID=3454632 RepID=UPI0019FD043F|nr:LCP family protein [filamentous cyanobacterium LEGE 07170]
MVRLNRDEDNVPVGQGVAIAAQEKVETPQPPVADSGSHASDEALPLPRRSPRIFRNTIWAIALLLTGITSTFVGAGLALFASNPFASSDKDVAEAGAETSVPGILRNALGYQVNRPVNILVMGIDRVLDAPEDSAAVFSGRSDTMLLVRLDPTANTVNLLSIPRDTQVYIPDLGITKINHANWEGGAELAARTVSENFDNVEIDRYVRVDTDAFQEIVDLVGGVEVYVPEPMQYTDLTQGLEIDLEPGLQVLNGDEAEQFARYRRGATGDIGRVQRQQQLLRALQVQVARPSVIPKVPQAIELLQQHIDTNLSLEEMLAIANFAMGLERDNLQMVMLPGRFSTPNESIASYWILDPNSRTRLMRDYFAADPVLDNYIEVQNVTRLRIAVQNATDRPGLSRQVVRALRDRGFEDLYVVEDSPEPLEQSELIVQRGDFDNGRRLQSLLGIETLVPASTGDLESDFTLRLGEDWGDRLEEQDRIEQ